MRSEIITKILFALTQRKQGVCLRALQAIVATWWDSCSGAPGSECGTTPLYAPTLAAASPAAAHFRRVTIVSSSLLDPLIALLRARPFIWARVRISLDSCRPANLTVDRCVTRLEGRPSGPWPRPLA